jgi:hypothetical protein
MDFKMVLLIKNLKVSAGLGKVAFAVSQTNEVIVTFSVLISISTGKITSGFKSYISWNCSVLPNYDLPGS